MGVGGCTRGECVCVCKREREGDVNSRLSRTNLLISASLSNVIVSVRESVCDTHNSFFPGHLRCVYFLPFSLTPCL